MAFLYMAETNLYTTHAAGCQHLPICLPENKLNVIRYLIVVLKCKVIKEKYSEPKIYRSKVIEQNKKCYRVNKNYCRSH
jgi:hypothetical protein